MNAMLGARKGRFFQGPKPDLLCLVFFTTSLFIGVFIFVYILLSKSEMVCNKRNIYTFINIETLCIYQKDTVNY